MHFRRLGLGKDMVELVMIMTVHEQTQQEINV